MYRGVLISGCWNRGGSTVYRGVLILGNWNRGFLLYMEVFSFQEVEIQRFHCVQRCPHFRRGGSTMHFPKKPSHHNYDVFFP